MSTKKRGRRKRFACALDELVKEAKKEKKEENTELAESIPVKSKSNFVHTHEEGIFHSKDDSTVSQPIHDVSTSAANNSQVIDLIGIYGYITLVQALELIPESFLSNRCQYIANILSVATNATVTVPDVMLYLDMLKSDICITGTPPSDLLWEVTFQYGFPHNLYLGPPVTTCLSCHAPLQSHHAPSVVTCYTLGGPLPAVKITLRCRDCGINYRYDQYGNTADGYRYYQAYRQSFVKATQIRYVSRECCALWAAAGHHAWTSFQASAEIYNELIRSTDNQNAKNLCKFFKDGSNCLNGEEEDLIGEEEMENDDHLSECCNQAELHRKVVANAFWNSEVEDELREQEWIKYRFHKVGDREKAMEKVDRQRASTVYPHQNCSDECKKRGCGTLFSIDGNWKLCYPVCMYQVPKEVAGFEGKLSYVDTCPNGPLPGKAFCAHHCRLAEREGTPTGLRDFLRFCGVKLPKESRNEIDENASSSDVSQVEAVVCTLKDENGEANAADCQGTSAFLSAHHQLCEPIDEGDEDEESRTDCNKETGEKKQLRKWTRGVWMCVSGGGLIQTWQPLYKSEGPSQVFLLVLSWLTAAFGHLDRSEWQKLVVSYDNMCHLDNLKVARKPLPLPGDLKYIWGDVQKIIDTLHIRNHRDQRCKSKYNPAELKENYPTYNTMSCEQTFVWLSRYKKVLCAMPKEHFHFYMHRMVKRRNKYIEYCYNHKKRPLLPKVRHA